MRMSIFRTRRIRFLFTCSVVFLQTLYYLIAFQINRTSSTQLSIHIESLLYEQPSDIPARNTSIQNESIPFADASISNSIDFVQPGSTAYDSLPPCQYSNFRNDTSYRISVDTTVNSFSIIEANYAQDLHVGGHWFPEVCRAEQRLAIIICYRNREIHLKLFLNNIHSFLKKQQLDYTIFVVNQHGTEQFNRAALFNVGFIEAMKLYSFNCFIFHDVDLIPEDLRNLYRCGDRPRHMLVEFSLLRLQNF